MKGIAKLFLIVIFLTAGNLTANAYVPDGVCVVTMFQQSNPEPGKDIEPDEEGQRKPSRPITVSIDKTNGVTVPGYNTEDILAYEVYTVDGDPVANFADEEDFITFIFFAEGTYEIRLQFEEVTLKGYISL